MKKDIKYKNKDFTSFITDLQNYATTYFPNTVSDLTNSESPSRLFMEMSAYVGDVLSFYLDNQIVETYINQAQDINNLLNIATVFGYKPKFVSPATTQIEITQLVPSILSGSTYIPDLNYALFIGQNTTLTSTNVINVNFVTDDDVDFSINTLNNPTEIEISNLDNLGNPTFFLLKKKVNATSIIENTKTFNVGSLQEFPTFTIEDKNIVEIKEIKDSENNIWYEVDSLGQDFIFEKQKNNIINNPKYNNNDYVTSLLKYKKVQRKFITKFISPTTLQIQFGSGNENSIDEEIIPNPTNVGLGINNPIRRLTTAYSPTNFIFTNTYGIAPNNTTLTVKYTTSNGILSNIPAFTINNISNLNTKFLNNNLNPTIANQIFNTLSCTNIIPATGGGNGDNITTLKQNIISNFNTQLRVVTPQDYLIRISSLPSNFGSVSKVYVEPSNISSDVNTSSPIDIYLLTYDNNKNLIPINDTLKNNIITYLSPYRMINDSINFKTPNIINIGIDFEIITKPNNNSNLVLLNCLNKLKDFFDIDKLQINQPIILRQLYSLLDNIDGVETVKNIKIFCKDTDNVNYSNILYDINKATKNNIIFPPRDISIFEIKYPDIDINGRIVNY